MRLRIARKIARRITLGAELDVYDDATLKTASSRLGRAWARARDSRTVRVLNTITLAPAVLDEATGLPMPDTSDYFAAHRVTSVRLRQAHNGYRQLMQLMHEVAP